MRQFDRDPTKFNGLEIFNLISKKEGYTISSNESLDKFIEKLKTGIEFAKNNPIALHGLRAQELFVHVLASLDGCVLIKQEDSGELLHNKSMMSIPDLRIILNNNTEMFIEIKNYRPNDLTKKKYKFKSNYVEGLLNYTNQFGKELKFAIYWSQMNNWTLLSLDSFNKTNSGYEIDILNAVKNNEMSILGDKMLATIPPLKLKILTDPNNNKSIGKDGKTGFTIGKVELYANDVLINDIKESNIAYYFMMYSEWISDEPIVEVKDGEIISLEFNSQPIESSPGQNFQTLGFLSTMISRQFNRITAPAGNIEKLSPSNKHGSLGISIPNTYKGKYLPLWIFNLNKE